MEGLLGCDGVLAPLLALEFGHTEPSFAVRHRQVGGVNMAPLELTDVQEGQKPLLGRPFC